ncbi:MAG: cyclic nucleotide-binding domain-containing protein [Thermodesulfobacteriota bacterium]
MSDLTKHEKLVDQYVQNGDRLKATQVLLALVTQYAQKHDFDKAEALREKIIIVDPSALSEVISAQDIIDTARSQPMIRSHREVWAELYDKLSAEEAEALESEMEEVSFNTGDIIFAQGEKKPNLYFVDAGHAKHLFTQGNREMFIKKVVAGNVANEDSFFDAGLCTSTLIAVDQVKVHYLPAITLLSWEGYMPTIEPALRDCCAKEVKIHDLLKDNSQDRRVQRRIPLPGRILLKIVDAEGKVVGKTIRGDLCDVSVGGVSFFVHTANREQAQMLLGHDLHLRLNIPPVMTEIEQIGKVLGVKSFPGGPEEKEKYSVHVQFSKALPEKSIIEAERFIKMVKIAESRR